MANATLFEDGRLDEEELQGRRAFRIDTDPWSAGPFGGPPGRDWDAFSATGEHEASFEWRTAIDKVRDAIRAVLASGDVVDAWERADIESWQIVETVEDSVEDALLDLDAESAAGDEGEERERHARALRAVLEPLVDGTHDLAATDGPYAVYELENDTHFHDAIAALELPEWAERWPVDDGGVGSGFTAWYLVLDAGRTLGDLEAWLDARRGKRSRAQRKVARGQGAR